MIILLLPVFISFSPHSSTKSTNAEIQEIILIKQHTLMHNQEVAGRLKHLQGCIESIETALVKFKDGALTSSYDLAAEQVLLQRQLDEIESNNRSLKSDIKAKTTNMAAVKSALIEKTALKEKLYDESELKALQR